MRRGGSSLLLLLVLLSLVALLNGFVPGNSDRKPLVASDSKSSFIPRSPLVTPHGSRTSTTSLNLFDIFRRKKNQDEDPDKDEPKESEPEAKDIDSAEDEKEKTPFFARFRSKDEDEATTETTVATSATPAVTATVESTPSPVPPPPAPPAVEKKPELSPLEKAQAMRAQAERMRLEAEKMDIQLTLEKIEKLEKQLAHARSKGESETELQSEMDALQAKIRGEAPKPVVKPVVKIADKKMQIMTTTAPTRTTTTTSIKDTMGFKGIISEQEGLLPFNQTEFKEQLERFKEAPNFMKKTMANMVAVDYDSVESINGTEVAVRFEKMERKDFSFLDVPKPVFSPKMIKDMEETVRNEPNEVFQDLLVEKAGGNVTALAVMLLENFYYEEMISKTFVGKNFGVKVDVDDRWTRIFEGKDDLTERQRTAEAFFPKSCRKQGEAPTEAQVNLFAAEVLPKASFQPSSKAEPAPGGYIIRGSNKNKNADKLMESIDQALAKSVVGEKLSVFYVKDFTVFGGEEDNVDPFDTPPILYVTGPDVTRERRPFLYSLVSGTGLATSWYLAVYPFLLNDGIMKKVEEQLNLANADMAYNLDFLTDMASPLFLSFLGIQLAHELGHQVAGAVHGINVTVPTFVPSLITGVTSTVTSFKSPPKNHKAMFDFAVAGPLTGIIASLAALYFGLQMTAFTDAQTYAAFPSLPLQILRQSSLGGGIIELVLGNGALSIPDAALGTELVSSIDIPLHPLAIAGYVSLLINALSLLPIGTTDGGRVALTLFGRGIKLLVGQIFLLILFFSGLFGSDLLLFYFSFVIFFQNGNEIPSRNEVDEVDFGRILVATFAGVLTLLTLIPMG